MALRFGAKRVLSVAIALKLITFRKSLPCYPVSFSLAGISRDDAQKWFRFKKEELKKLQLALRIPKKIVTAHRDRACGLQALCILLRHLAYPNRIIETSKMFRRSNSAFNRIFNHVLCLVYDKHQHLLKGMSYWKQDSESIFWMALRTDVWTHLNWSG